jgi:UDP-N-acetylglucosamine acyltransferase
MGFFLVADYQNSFFIEGNCVMKIHRTAIVSPDAQLADDVEIGAYVSVGKNVVVGPGCIIHAHAVLSGNVLLGKNNTVGYGAVIGADPQDHAFHPGIQSRVVIGDGNMIREYCTIHRGTAEGSATVMGDGNYLMVGTHLGHNAHVGNRVVMENGVLLAGHVHVEDEACLGGSSVFHQFVRIGRLTLAQGHSAITKDVPPFTMTSGHYIVGPNLAGLRGAGYSREQRQEVKKAFKLLYRTGLNTTQALQIASQLRWGETGRAFFDFVAAAKKRGICDIRSPLSPEKGKRTRDLLLRDAMLSSRNLDSFA